MFQCYIFCY